MPSKREIIYPSEDDLSRNYEDLLRDSDLCTNVTPFYVRLSDCRNFWDSRSLESLDFAVA